MRLKLFSIALVLLSIFALAQNPGISSTAGKQTDQNQQLEPASPGGLALPNYQMDFMPVVSNGRFAVAWANGYLVSFNGETKEPVTLYDKTGKWLFENPLTFEDAIQTYVHDAATTSLGTAVVAAGTINAEGAFTDLIVEVGKSGIRRVLRTTPFYISRICATDDGTVWAYGRELTEDRRAELRAHYPMLREYSLDKGELRAVLDRATIHPPKGVPVTGATSDEFQMRCNAGKVVLLSGATNELIEYDLAASTLHRWPLAPLPGGVDISRITGAAMTDSGEVYVSTYDAPHVKALTRILHVRVDSSGTALWDSITAIPSAGKWFVLMGSDGEDLVYSQTHHLPTVFWAKASLTEPAK